MAQEEAVAVLVTVADKPDSAPVEALVTVAAEPVVVGSSALADPERVAAGQ